jgi:two-component SAPR family response regulator
MFTRSGDSAATAYLSAGDKESAIRHFERAIALDALLLPDIESLLGIYREAGDRVKVDTLMRRVREVMQTGPGRAATPRH